MNLYLLRHGEAESYASSDSERQLTTAGRRDVRNVASQFIAENLTLDRCFVSPALRAQQTAEEFLSVIPGNLKAETEPALSADKRAAQVIDFLQTVSEDNVLVISHNPILSELLALLTEGNISHMQILGTSNLACISLDIIGLGMGTTPFILQPDAILTPLS